MLNQACAICEKNDFKIIYKKNFNISNIDEKVFSARRLPDKIHYQIVKCNQCGLVYSNPILFYTQIEKLYKKSFTRYDSQITNLTETYGFYLRELGKYQINKTSLLEIGCGNGFFLKEALKQGYKQVFGVEPGKKSVEKADVKIKKNIIIDIFKSGLFKKNFFDVICCFQTFDHIADPNQFLTECFNILKPKGLIIFYNHDVRSISARLLGERSPIIDIEHTYLYSQSTINKIFQKHKFKVLKVGNAFTIHKLSYWLFLLPLPIKIKTILLKIISILKLNNLKIKINPGNLFIIAQK